MGILEQLGLHSSVKKIKFEPDAKVVLWGVGEQGKKLLATSRTRGIEVCAFCDNNPEKWGSSFDGVPIISPNDLAEYLTQFDANKLLLQLAISPHLPHYEDIIKSILNQLKELGISQKYSVFPENHTIYDSIFFDSQLKFAQEILDMGLEVEEGEAIIEELYDMLEDEQSKKILEYRLLATYGESRYNYQLMQKLGSYASKSCGDFLRRTQLENVKDLFIKSDISKGAPIIFCNTEESTTAMFKELQEDKDLWKSIFENSEILFWEKERKEETHCCGLPIVTTNLLEERHLNDGYFVMITTDDVPYFTDFLMKQCVNFKRWLLTYRCADENEIYFDKDIIRLTSNEVFADVGVFDGGSSINFVENTKGAYNKIYLFEPNQEAIAMCKESLSVMSIDNYELFPVGLWDKKEMLSFSGSGASFSLNDGNENELSIPVNSLDNLIGENEVTFIKMDIEGAEFKALQGAKKSIMKHKPKLAISLYHKPEDLFEIPSYIRSLVPEYKFYLRHYSSNWCDTVLYAVL